LFVAVDIYVAEGTRNCKCLMSSKYIPFFILPERRVWLVLIRLVDILSGRGFEIQHDLSSKTVRKPMFAREETDKRETVNAGTYSA
jgi:hypothetical protein